MGFIYSYEQILEELSFTLRKIQTLPIAEMVHVKSEIDKIIDNMVLAETLKVIDISLVYDSFR